MTMDNRAFSTYLSIFGFVLIFVGILVASLSVNMVQTDYSSLTDSSAMLLAGAMIGVAGVLLLLLGFLSMKRRTSYLYY